MFYDVLDNLCKEKNTSVTAFTKDVLGMSSGNVTKWRNGKEPSREVLKTISNYFDVSVDYLLGRETPQIKSVVNFTDLDLTEEECKFMRKFKKLSPKQQGYIMGKVDTYLEEYGEDNDIGKGA